MRVGVRSGRSKTAFTTLKMAVLAPTPSASVMIAINVNPPLEERPGSKTQSFNNVAMIPPKDGF
jgi:hypothetical protein